jgi:hypothetical protein
MCEEPNVSGHQDFQEVLEDLLVLRAEFGPTNPKRGEFAAAGRSTHGYSAASSSFNCIFTA